MKELKMLRAQGKYLVDPNGEKVFLRGICIGSWLNMEAFMTGYIGTESQMWRALEKELGEERYNAFRSAYLDNFITEADYEYMASLGVNAVRLGFNHRYLESDDNPFEYKEDGFKYLDRAIAWGKKYGIYTILDMHAVPGWQNNRWHCDNPTGNALLWESKFYRTRAARLWGHIAAHYKNEPAVAGYDLMNEPEAPDIVALRNMYADMIREIRAAGDQHVCFVEGNDRGKDFSRLEDLIGENVAFSSHNYNSVLYDARNYPGQIGDSYADYAYLERVFKARNRFMLEHGVVSYSGEFSNVYFNDVDKPSYGELSKLRALDDQLQIFNRYEQHWTIWSYKDVRFCGLVIPQQDCEYMRRINPIIELKNRLALDVFPSRRIGVIPRVTHELLYAVAQETGELLQDYSLNIPSLNKQVGEEAIGSCLSGLMAPLYAVRFADMSAAEITQMIEHAFNTKYMNKRTYLADVLKKNLSAE